MDPKPVPPKEKSRRGRIIALAVVGTIAAYGVIVGLVVPPFAKKTIAEKVGERLGREVTLDDLSINPFTLQATLKGFRVMEADRRSAFASFDQLDVNASITSLYRLAPVADEVTLAGLKVNLVRDGETHYNISDILSRLAAADAKAPKSSDKAQFSFSNIRVENARIDFDDRPKGAKHAVSEIDIAIPFISNLPTHLKEYVQPTFAAKVNGTPLRIKGETLPFENSLRTHIALDLDGFEAFRYVEYSPTPLPVKVDSGKLDARISVRFTQTAGKNPSVDVAGKLSLYDIRVSSPAEGPVAAVERVDVDIASLDPLAGVAKVTSIRVANASASQGAWQVPVTEAKDIGVDIGKKTVRIETLATNGGVLEVKRRRDGSIEIPLRTASAEGAPATAPASAPSPWVVALGKLTLDGYKVAVSDASVKPAAVHHVAIAHLEAADLGTAKGTRSTMSAHLGTDKGGTVELDSTFSIDPLALNAKIDARRIDLTAFRPYAEQFATVQVKSANASAKGTLGISGEGNAMKIAYAGTAEVANVATVDTSIKEDLLNWDSVKAKGVGFQWSREDALNLNVAEIAVNKAYSRLIITPEGKINLQQLKAATPAEANAPVAVAAPEQQKPRNIRIDRIAIADSRLNFTDHFIKPNYTADVGELNGSVTNLSSDPATRGVVDLKGSYDQTSPVTIGGTINPLSGNLFVDIAAKGKDIELPKLSAYSARYAGYGIKQGKLTLDVKYHIENGKMQGRNIIFLDQLVFGDKVEGPEATKLPVIFAVNLLKDSKGQINLELPISGSLEDPKFEIGALITQVVANLFKKAITSPFSLLTAAFSGGGGGNGTAGSGDGAGGDDLAYVEFVPGHTEIGPAGEKKLDQLSKALLDRPAIKVEMAGRVDADKDLDALKRTALQAKVKAAKGGELAEGEYPRYLKVVYEREFPPKPPARDAPKEGKDAAPKEVPVEAMEAQLLERIAVSEDELRALGTRRAELVKGYLVGKGQLPADRVLVAAAEPADSKAQARVDFTLR